MQNYTMEQQATDVVEGYYLEGEKSLFSLVVPEATENLIINPSPVVNTTGYSAMAGTLTSSSTRQRRGPNSVRYAPTAAVNDGAYFGTVTTVTGWNTFSLDFWGYPGIPYKIYFADTSGNQLGGITEFVGEGLWRRPIVKLYETAGTTRRVYFTKNGSTDTNFYYVDGLQVEAKDHATTYTDGSMTGYVPGQTAYYWTGISYSSISVRIADTGSGGQVVPLSEYGFKLTAHTGLGMSTANNISFPYARIDGENYQTTRMTGRDFSLMGTITGQGLPELMQRKANLITALHPSRTVTRQPLLLLYQYKDECGLAPSENIYKIQCSYIDGLKGSVTNKNQERVGLNFRMANPDMEIEGIYGTTLTYQTSTAAVVYIISRNITGLWSKLGSSVAGGEVLVVTVGPDGMIYVGGSFFSAGGVANTATIARWDPFAETWNAVGAGGTIGNSVRAIVFAADGTMYVGGGFASMAGVANTAGIAKWNGAAWSAVGTGVTGGTQTVYSIAIDGLGMVYAGGLYSQMGGIANTAAIAKWNGSAWSAMGTGATGLYVNSLCVDSLNRVYAGGSFTAMGGVSNTNFVALWNGTAWTALGTGIAAGAGTDGVYTMVIDKVGSVYVGGKFSAAGGVSNTGNIAVWNGSSWKALSTGISGTNAIVENLAWDNDLLILSGFFTGAGTLVLDQPYVGWNGSSFILLDAIFPNLTHIRSTALSPRGTFYIGFSQVGTVISSYTTNVIADSNFLGYPTFYFTGPGKIYRLQNTTTKKVVHFNLTLLSSEKATLKNDKNKLTLSSSFRGNIDSAMLSGSVISDFNLLPGTNEIRVFVAGSTTGDTSVVMTAKRYTRRLQ